MSPTPTELVGEQRDPKQSTPEEDSHDPGNNDRRERRPIPGCVQHEGRRQAGPVRFQGFDGVPRSHRGKPRLGAVRHGRGGVGEIRLRPRDPGVSQGSWSPRQARGRAAARLLPGVRRCAHVLDTDIVRGANEMESANRTARSYLDLDGLRGQYLSGVQDPSRIDPDNWVIDKALIDRPGVDEIMLDLLYDIPNQVPVFTAMQQFLREYRPTTLVATGANDEIFPEQAVRQILTDHPGTEYHALQTGHFALEDKAADIAALMRDFLA